MTRIINLNYLFVTLLFFLTFSFSHATFTIHNSDLEQMNVFSLKDLDFYVSSKTDSPITLSYSLVNGNSTQVISKELLLVSCNEKKLSKFCLKDSFLNYMNSTNTTFTTALEYTFKRGSTSKEIYLDFIQPEINSTFVFDESNNNIELEVDIKDNLKFKVNTSILISTPFNSNKLVVYNKSITNLELNNKFEIKQGGNYTLEVTSQDKAGNFNRFEKILEVEDTFAPKVNNISIINDNGEKNIEFIIEDENNIKSWQFNSKTKVYGENFESNKKIQTVLTPFVFDLKSTHLEVEDVLNNSALIKLPSVKEITLNSENKFSDTFLISTKNANSCKIVDGLGNKDISLDKKSNKFSTSLKSYSQKKYSISIECVNSNYKLIQEVNFSIDRSPPKIESFDLIKDNNGNLELSFEVSDDTDSILVYRNNDKITTLKGNEDSYLDKNVVYSNSYKYYIEVRDDLGNSKNSDELKETPNKVDIYFEVAYEDLGDFVLILIDSEKNLVGNTNLIFDSLNENGIKFFKNSDNKTLGFKISSKQSTFKIKKELEDIKIKFAVEDSFKNEEFQTLTIPKREISSFEIIENATLNSGLFNIKNSSLVENLNDKAGLNSNFKEILIWLVLSVIFLIVILGIYLIILNKIKIDSYFLQNRNHKKNKKNKSTKNLKIEKLLDDTTSKRISEHLIHEEEKKKKKLEEKKKRLFNKKSKEKVTSNYRTSKYGDLNKSRNDVFKKDFNVSSKYSEYNVVSNDKKKEGSQKKFKDVVTYSHSFLDNLISKIVDDESHGTKKLDTAFSQKEIDSTRKNIFSDEDSMRFKLSRNELIEKKRAKLEEKKRKEHEKLLKEQEKKRIEDEKKSNRLNEPKSSVDWGNYLDKKSKSRKWFLIQKEVENETKFK